MDIVATLTSSILSGLVVSIVTKYLIGNSMVFFPTDHEMEHHTSESDGKPDSHNDFDKKQ